MKVLVIRLSSIGDIVLTTPVIRCLFEQLEKPEIHVLTKSQYSTMLSPNPNITRVIPLENTLGATIDILRKEKYDCIIDLHKNLRSKRIRRGLNVQSYDFPKLNIKKWLLVNFKSQVMPKVHIVDRYFEAVKALGVKNDGKGLDYFIPEEDAIQPTDSFGSQNYVAVAMGAQYATKVLPISKLCEILDKIDDTIVLLGGKEDIQRGEELVAQLSSKTILNYCGRFSLNQSADAVRKARVLLTNDTGLMHIASAFDTPIVSVWGNTVPELGMYPYRPTQLESYSIHQVKGLSCRPCSKIGFEKCPKKHFNCMMQQNAQAIATDIRKNL